MFDVLIQRTTLEGEKVGFNAAAAAEARGSCSRNEFSTITPNRLGGSSKETHYIAFASIVLARDHIQPLSRIMNDIELTIRYRCAGLGEVLIKPVRTMTAHAIEFSQHIDRYMSGSQSQDFVDQTEPASVSGKAVGTSIGHLFSR